jgi:acyl-CoA thioesterase FadM
LLPSGRPALGNLLMREADVARFKWMTDTGIFHAGYARGMAFVTAAQTIRYRRELAFNQRYRIVTRALGWDGKAVFIEQRFVVDKKHHHHHHHGSASPADEEVHAVLIVREGVMVSKAAKTKFPKTADAPVHFVLHDVLGWPTDRVPEMRSPPPDVAAWLDTIQATHARVTGASAPSSPTS